MSLELSEKMPEHLPKWNARTYVKKMSDKIPENLPDRMPEFLPVEMSDKMAGGDYSK